MTFLYILFYQILGLEVEGSLSHSSQQKFINKTKVNKSLGSHNIASDRYSKQLPHKI